MKITSNQEEKKFEPITFNITVESREELVILQRIFGTADFATVALNHLTASKVMDFINPIYKYITNILKQ